MQSGFHFINNPEEINSRNNTFCVALNENISSKENLLNEYYTKFGFPYFGFNWDALDDCLKDLYWIEQKKVVVYHSQLPQLNVKDLKIYLNILRCTIWHWEKWEEHSFEVYFNLQDQNKVQLNL